MLGKYTNKLHRVMKEQEYFLESHVVINPLKKRECKYL